MRQSTGILKRLQWLRELKLCQLSIGALLEQIRTEVMLNHGYNYDGSQNAGYGYNHWWNTYVSSTSKGAR